MFSRMVLDKASGSETKGWTKGWSDLLRRHIYETKKLPCIFTFHRRKVNAYDTYFKAVGKCNITCIVKPSTDNPVTFSVTTKDSSNVPHSKKIRLQGAKRRRVMKSIISEAPKQYRRKLINECMKFGDSEPPFLYELQALRKARQDANKNEKLWIHKLENLFDNLAKIRNDIQYNKFIRNIVFDKFFITYSSPEQISINNDIQKKTKNAVSIDSTGSIAYKIQRESGISNHIF